MTDPTQPETTTIDIVVFEEPDQDELEGIDPIDMLDQPLEFADFDVWCTFTEDWAAVWRPQGDTTWFCRNCGATDHRFRDHEGAGA